jgi:hypothetical protein
MFDMQQFICSVRIRSILWDVSCEEYCSKTKKYDARLEVCREMCEGLDTFEVDEYNRNLNLLKTAVHIHCLLNGKNPKQLIN